jgi:hypothetical protein
VTQGENTREKSCDVVASTNLHNYTQVYVSRRDKN